jgi:hypothetical protein
MERLPVMLRSLKLAYIRGNTQKEAKAALGGAVVGDVQAGFGQRFCLGRATRLPLLINAR